MSEIILFEQKLLEDTRMFIQNSIKFNIISVDSINKRIYIDNSLENIIIIVNSLLKSGDISSLNRTKDSLLLVNSDINGIAGEISNLGYPIITYGLNSKASITASSIEEFSLTCCIQRGFYSINEKFIEQQEVVVPKRQNENVYSILISIIILLFLEINISGHEEKYACP